MRLGDAERELLFDQLGRHAASGRIDLDELERRVAAITVAGTRQEAAAVLSDLPPLAPTPARRRRGRPGKGHGEVEKPAPDWQPTSERFRDPRTDQVLRVWVDAAGARHYVPDEVIP